jgi:hypothetical protein
VKRGCLVGLAVLAGLIGLYYSFLLGRFSPPAHIVGALVGGVVTFLGLSLLNNARFSFRDLRVVRRSLTGARRPADGEVAAAVGTLHPIGAPLKAPFSGRDCVLYDYEMTGPGRSSENASNVIAGFALTPSVIRTSMLGDMKLLGYPNLDGFAKEEIEDPAARDRARAYIAATTFQDMRGLNVAKMYSELKDFMTDDDGAVRKDWRMEADLDPGEERVLNELVVPVGEQVSVVGIYSAARHGLVPDVAKRGSVNRMTRGDAGTVTGALRVKVVGAIVGGLLLIGIGNAVLWGVLTLREGSLAPQKAEDLRSAAQSGDVAGIERLLSAGAPVDARDLDGRTALFLAGTGQAAEALIAGGADVNASKPDGQTPLMEAASAGRTDVVKALIAGRARLDDRHHAWGSTAIMQAEDAGHQEIVDLLRASGALDLTVTEKNGRPMDEASEPFLVCAAYLKAVQEADVPALQRLSRFHDGHGFQGVDFAVWRGARPVEPNLVNGFMNETGATLTVRGVTGGGFVATWVYHLARHPDGWKIVREHWQTQ